jgi:C1A family cysteine protease
MNDVLLAIEPSPKDGRDWIAETIFPESTVCPKILDLRPELQEVRNQGSSGTCAAQSASCMKEWQEKKDVNLSTHLSPQFIYNLRENQGEGMFGRDVMRILSKIGVCCENDFVYGRKDMKEDILNNIELMQKAINFKIKSYARVTTIDATKKALYQNGPCVVCFPVYDHSTEMWRPKKQGQAMIGGHAMTFVGYDKKSFIIRNSWGDGWGDKGYCYYPFNQWGSHWEIWTTIDSKSVEIKGKKCKFPKCLNN